MAIVIESKTATNGSGLGGSFNMPATRPNGDLYIAILVCDTDMWVHPGGSSVQTTAVSGWKTMYNGPDQSYINGWVGYRIGSSEPSSYSFTMDASDGWQVLVMRVSGFNTNTPVSGVFVDDARSGTATTVASPPAIAYGSGDMIIGVQLTDSTVTMTFPSSMTNEYSTSAQACHMSVGSYSGASVGNVSSATIGDWVHSTARGYIGLTFTIVADNPSLPVAGPPETTVTGTGTSHSFNMPSNRPDGLLYVVVIGIDADNIATPPSGWTEICASTDNGLQNYWVGYRVGSSEPASYSFTLDASDGAEALVFTVDGADTSNVVDASNSEGDYGSVSSVGPLSLTTTSENTLCFWGLVVDSDEVGRRDITPSGRSVVFRGHPDGPRLGMQVDVTIEESIGAVSVGAMDVWQGFTDTLSRFSFAITAPAVAGLSGISAFNTKSQASISKWDGVLLTAGKRLNSKA